MLEGIVICTALLGCLWLLYLYNRPAEEKDVPSPLASKVPNKAPERKASHSDLIARPAYYGAAPAPQPAMDHTLLFVAATIDTSEPERYSSPTPSYTSPSYDDSSSRSSSSSWGGDCGSSSSSSDSSSSSSDSCSY